MTKYRLNKWGTKLLKNDRPLFDWANDSDDIVDLLNEQEEIIQELKTCIEQNRKNNMALLSYIKNVLGCKKDCRFYSHKELVKIISRITEEIKRNVS